MVAVKDLLGQKFSRLKVLGRAPKGNRKTTAALWLCQCDCGSMVTVSGYELRSGHTKSCGCYSRDSAKSRSMDLTGKKFNKLLAIEKLPAKESGTYLYRFLCDCGTEIILKGSTVKHGSTKSCGCLVLETSTAKATTHGDYNSLEYTSWRAMKGRCLDTNNVKYPSYGGRADRPVTIDDSWLGADGYACFLRDMGRRPTKQHSIDRYPDPYGDYTPKNCRWATRKEQANNRRESDYIHTRDKKTGKFITETGEQ